MKGIVRRLDELGRITLPIEYRRALDYDANQGLLMYLKGNVICLKKGKGRKLDSLGRYTIPIEVRRTLKFDECELVDTWIEDGEVRIRKASLQCVICGSEDERKLLDVEGVLICRKCGTKVIDKFMED